MATLHYAYADNTEFRTGCGAELNGPHREYAVWVHETVTCDECLQYMQVIGEKRFGGYTSLTEEVPFEACTECGDSVGRVTMPGYEGKMMCLPCIEKADAVRWAAEQEVIQ